MSNKYPHPYTYYSTIKELDPNSVVQMDTEHDDLSTLVWLDRNPNNITNEQIETKRQELIDDWEKKIYKMDRIMEYPSFADQLDYIFHNGVDKWKEDIVQPVKDKYPKPE